MSNKESLYCFWPFCRGICHDKWQPIATPHQAAPWIMQSGIGYPSAYVLLYLQANIEMNRSLLSSQLTQEAMKEGLGILGPSWHSMSSSSILEAIWATNLDWAFNTICMLICGQFAGIWADENLNGTIVPASWSRCRLLWARCKFFAQMSRQKCSWPSIASMLYMLGAQGSALT